jgi:hypothetical protein
MTVKRSPELEAVYRRLNHATVDGNKNALRNLFSLAPETRVVTAIGECVTGQEDIVNMSVARHREAGVVRYEYQHLEASSTAMSDGRRLTPSLTRPMGARTVQVIDDGAAASASTKPSTRDDQDPVSGRPQPRMPAMNARRATMETA